MDNILVFGSGGHAKVVIDIIEKSKSYKLTGLVDGFKPPGTLVYGYEVLGDETYIQNNNISVGVVAIGDNWVRGKVVTSILSINPHFKFVAIIHPSASIARGVTIGDGTIVMAGSILNSDAKIGEHCILNTKSSIDHDNHVGNFVTIAPNATTGGNVTIGNFSVLSLGANVVHSITIGEHAVIGAGSTVLSDIDSYSVAYGTPAKVIRKREIGEKYL